MPRSSPRSVGACSRCSPVRDDDAVAAAAQRFEPRRLGQVRSRWRLVSSNFWLTRAAREPHALRGPRRLSGALAHQLDSPRHRLDSAAIRSRGLPRVLDIDVRRARDLCRGRRHSGPLRTVPMPRRRRLTRGSRVLPPKRRFPGGARSPAAAQQRGFSPSAGTHHPTIRGRDLESMPHVPRARRDRRPTSPADAALLVLALARRVSVSGMERGSSSRAPDASNGSTTSTWHTAARRHPRESAALERDEISGGGPDPRAPRLCTSHKTRIAAASSACSWRPTRFIHSCCGGSTPHLLVAG